MRDERSGIEAQKSLIWSPRGIDRADGILWASFGPALVRADGTADAGLAAPEASPSESWLVRRTG